eukprot:TRINITY_DN1288_c0_g1_i2.p1 TRINITY_DN1288_c0_g1~~TRINITY_DN1288_c0_g1_i2.p1  ORF type:complete len:487 (+),score=58.40 TRINITY_DN1288_c0_g1_i2:369-1829(+)
MESRSDHVSFDDVLSATGCVSHTEEHVCGSSRLIPGVCDPHEFVRESASPFDPGPFPKIHEWKSHPSKGERTLMSADTAWERSLAGAKAEEDAVRRNIRRALAPAHGDAHQPSDGDIAMSGVSDEGLSPTVSQLASVWFGDPYCRLWEAGLGGASRERVLRLLGTTCHHAAHSASATKFYDPAMRINGSGCLSHDEYVSSWKALGNHGRPASSSPSTSSSSSRGPVQLWQKMETCLNETCRTVFIEGNTGMIHLSVDDDKVHHGSKRKTWTGDLKKTRHVKCNRRGLVCETAVSPFRGFLYQFRWERHGDTAALSFQRLATGAFGELPLALQRVEFNFDRGYTDMKLVAWLLQHGGDIQGTVQRTPWVPFTFDQVVSQNDTRELVPSKGTPALFIKTAKATSKRSQDLAMFIYRCGGKATMFWSSIHQLQEWDMVLLRRHIPSALPCGSGSSSRLGDSSSHGADVPLRLHPDSPPVANVLRGEATR